MISDVESKQIQDRINQLKKQIEEYLCSYVPNALLERKEHKVSSPSPSPYAEGFDENQIPTKARS